MTTLRRAAVLLLCETIAALAEVERRQSRRTRMRRARQFSNTRQGGHGTPVIREIQANTHGNREERRAAKKLKVQPDPTEGRQ